MFFNANGTKLFILHAESASPYHKFLSEFTSGSTNAFNAADVGKKVVGNSGSAIITSTAGAYTSVTAFADTSAISSWQLFGAEGKADGSGIAFTQAGAPGGIPTNTLTDQSGPHTIHTGFFNQGFWWSNDGQYYYQLSQGTSTIVKVKCTTPWDLSTQTDEQTVGTTGTSHGITVSEDGLNIYYGGYDARIRRKPLSTAHDLSTAGSETSILCTDLNVAASYPWDFDISSDGTKLFFLSHIGGSHDGIGTLNLSTPYAIHTGVTLGTVLTNFDGGGNSQTFFSFNSDGSKLFVSDNTTSIYYWNLSSAYTLPSSATSDGSISFSGSNGVRSMVFNQYLFYTSFHDDRSGALGVEHEKQNRWTLSTSIDASSTIPAYSQYFPAFTNSSNGQINSSSWQDINSMTADETKNGGDIFYAVSTDNRTSWGVAKASDGVRKIARNNSGTWQYNNDAGTLEGFDYANATTTGDTLTVDVSNVGVAGGSNQGIIFSGDGTKFYFVYQATSSNSRIYQVTLGTAWDLTSGTTKYTFNPSVTQISAGSIGFNQNGTALYIAWRAHPGTARYFKKFTLSTAWDLSTASGGVNSANLNSSGDFETCRGLTVGLNEEFIVTTDYAASDDHLAKFTFATAGDVTSSITKSESTNVTSYTNFPPVGLGNTQLSIAGPQFFDNGNKLFFMNYSYGGDAYIVNLTSAYDITSGTLGSTTGDISGAGTWMAYGVKPDGTRLYIFDHNSSSLIEYSAENINYDTSETWVNGTNNNEHATLQQALTSQAFNRMNKAQLDAVADGYHFSQDSADTLDLMIAPYATSGTSPISDGVTINYDAASKYKQAIHGTEYDVEFTTTNSVDLTSKISANLKARVL